MKRYLDCKIEMFEEKFIEIIDPQVVSYRETLRIFGGCDQDYRVSKNVVEIDLGKKSISRSGNSTTKLKVGQALWQLPESTVLFGGRNQKKENNKEMLKQVQFTNALETFDIARENTKPIKVDNSTNPSEREMVKSVIVNDKQILVIGGNDQEQIYEDIFLLSFSGTGAKWSYLGKLSKMDSMPFGKFSLTRVGDKIYLLGGLRKVGNVTQLSRDLYYIEAQMIQSGEFKLEKPEYGKMVPIADHEVAVIDNRYMVVIGGESISPSGFNQYTLQFIPNTQVWCYDTQISQWFRLLKNITPRIRFRTFTKDCEIFIFGGLKNYSTFNSSFQIVRFTGFKLDSTCNMCKSIYNLRTEMRSNSQLSELSLSGPIPLRIQNGINADIGVLEGLVRSREFNLHEALSLLVENGRVHKANNVYISSPKVINDDLKALEILDDSTIDPNWMEGECMNQYLQPIILSALRLGRALILIHKNNAKNKNHFLYIGRQQPEKNWRILSFSLLDETQLGLHQEYISASLKEYMCWDEIVSMNNAPPMYFKKGFTKLLILGSELALQENIISLYLGSFLSTLYLQNNMSITLAGQEIRQEDFRKLCLVESPCELIEQIRIYESNKLPSILVYHHNRLLSDYSYLLKEHDTHLGSSWIIVLAKSVAINILKNRIEVEKEEEQVIKAINDVVAKKSYSPAQKRAGDQEESRSHLSKKRH